MIDALPETEVCRSSKALAFYRWMGNVRNFIAENKKILIALFILDIGALVGGWLYKYYWIGALNTGDYELFEPAYSLGPFGDLVFDIFFYPLVGIIVLITAVAHFGLLPIAVGVKGSFSIGSSLAVFQLAGKQPLLIFTLGYLPDLLFKEVAYLLTICVCLRIGIATVRSIRQRKRTPEFYQAHRQILTMFPILVVLWTVAAAIEVSVSYPLYWKLIAG